jgi:hypothetical protein
MARDGGLDNDYRENLLTIGPFGGLDPTTAPYYVAANNFVDGQNFIPNQLYGGFVTALGRINAFTGDLPGVPNGSFKMAHASGPDVYLWAVDNGGVGSIYYAEYGGTPAPLSLPVPLTPGQTTYFASVGKWVFVSNGVDIPIKIDSSLNVTYWGIVAPTTAPTAAAAGAGGLLGNYNYFVTFGNAVQESSQSPASNTVTATNQDVQLTNIPTSPDPQVTLRYIYRVGGALGTIQRVGTINDNTTTTFLDTLPDNQVTGPFIARRDPPPPFTIICSHQERVFGFGIPTDNCQVQWSNLNEPWGFNQASNVLEVGSNTAGDFAVGLISTGSVLLLLKSRNPYIIYGNTDADFASGLQKIGDNIGCLAGKSCIAIDGVGYWLGNQGVWSWNGGVTQLSDGKLAQSNIKSILDNMPLADKQAAQAFGYQHMFMLSFPLTVDKTYFYDATRSQQWYPISWSTPSVYFNPEDQVQVVGANRTVVGEIDAWFQTPTDLGNPITSYLVSGVTDSGMLEATKEYRYMMVEAPAQPGATCTLILTVNPGLQQYVFPWTFDLGVPGEDDTGTRHMISLPMSQVGFECQLKIVVISTQQTIVERAAVRGIVRRKDIQLG